MNVDENQVKIILKLQPKITKESFTTIKHY